MFSFWGPNNEYGAFYYKIRKKRASPLLWGCHSVRLRYMGFTQCFGNHGFWLNVFARTCVNILAGIPVYKGICPTPASLLLDTVWFRLQEIRDPLGHQIVHSSQMIHTVFCQSRFCVECFCDDMWEYSSCSSWDWDMFSQKQSIIFIRKPWLGNPSYRDQESRQMLRGGVHLLDIRCHRARLKIHIVWHGIETWVTDILCQMLSIPLEKHLTQYVGHSHVFILGPK